MLGLRWDREGWSWYLTRTCSNSIDSVSPVKKEASGFGIPLSASFSFLHLLLFPYPLPLNVLLRFLKVVALAWFPGFLNARLLFKPDFTVLNLATPSFGPRPGVKRRKLRLGTDWQVPWRCQDQVWIYASLHICHTIECLHFAITEKYPPIKTCASSILSRTIINRWLWTPVTQIWSKFVHF